MYLPADALDLLFERVTELRAPGGRVAAETVGVHSEERREQMRERFAQLAASFEMKQAIDVQELMYDDPDRADVTDWLNQYGWSASGVTSQAEMKRLDRWVPTQESDEDAFSTFVVGERRQPIGRTPIPYRVVG